MMDKHTDEESIERDLSLLMRTLLPVFNGRAFAIGDACVAAVHYGACFEGMKDFSFGMLRKDYESAFPAILSALSSAGFDYVSDIKCQQAVLRRPYITIPLPHSIDGSDVSSVNIYPLDEIPEQKILRFRLFKQAGKILRQLMRIERDFNDVKPDTITRELRSIQRFNGIGSGFCSNLFSSEKGKTVFQRSYSCESFYPVRLVSFAGCTIPIAHNVASWTVEMTPKREKTIRIVQEKGLECLNAVDRACGALGLNYFLVGGSMLGSLRHKGFIPWDDDSDVGMLRKDYARFCRKCKNVLGRGYFLQLPHTDRHSHFVYARLRMDGMQYISNYNEDKKFHKGIWVDIFPFDARPRSELLAKIQRKIAGIFARKAMNFRRKREYAIADCRLDSSALPMSDRVYMRAYAAVSLFFPIRLCLLAYHIAARFFNPFLARSKNARYVSFVPSYTTISREELFPLRRVPYDSSRLCIPHDADSFLTRQYGNYMQLPPFHERCAEHGFRYLITEQGERIDS